MHIRHRWVLLLIHLLHLQKPSISQSADHYVTSRHKPVAGFAAAAMHCATQILADACVSLLDSYDVASAPGLSADFVVGIRHSSQAASCYLDL